MTVHISEDDPELLHYGVKGMKWGVRKSREERKKERTKKAANRLKKQADIKSARVKKKSLEKKLGQAEEAYYNSKTKKGQARTLKTLKKLEDEYYDTSELAKQKTIGEKWMLAAGVFIALEAAVGTIAYVTAPD